MYIYHIYYVCRLFLRCRLCIPSQVNQQNKDGKTPRDMAKCTCAEVDALLARWKAVGAVAAAVTALLVAVVEVTLTVALAAAVVAGAAEE